MWVLNGWLVDIGTGALGYTAWLLSKSDHILLFALCISAIAIWNAAEGVSQKYK